MSEEELEEIGLKRYCDGSIRDKYGHFAGNSGIIPGTPGVDAVEDYLIDEGYKIKSREISVRNAEGKLRRYDIVVESPDGNVIGIEVKSGKAARTRQQVDIDEELKKSGGFNTVGRKAKESGINRIDSVEIIHIDDKGIISKE